MAEERVVIRRVYYEWLAESDGQEFKNRLFGLANYAMGKAGPPKDMPKEFIRMIAEDNEELDMEDRAKARKSTKYKEWRIDVFTRDDFTCQICGKVGGTLNAHHIKPYAKYKELRFDVDNGITLCRDCHIELHRRAARHAKQFRDVHGI